MEKNTNNSNYLVNTIIFLLIVGASCLLFFGLGPEVKTTNELISFGILIFSEVLIFSSIIISCLLKRDISELLSSSILYFVAAFILNYLIRISVTKDLIVWNVFIFIVYLIIVLATFVKKRK